MKARILAVILGASAMGLPMLAGCDREVAHDETVKTKPDGTAVHDETTVKKQSDGTVVKTQEKSVDKPANPNP